MKIGKKNAFLTKLSKKIALAQGPYYVLKKEEEKSNLRPEERLIL